MIKPILKKALVAGFLFWTSVSFAQKSFPTNGVADNRTGKYAFTNATIQTDFQTTVSNATLLVTDGKIEAVGANVAIPKDAIVIDLKGKFVYPSMVEAFGEYGIAKPQRAGGNWWESAEKFVSDKKGAFGWNEAVKPEMQAKEIFVADSKTAESLRKIGFGAISTHHSDGIARGTGALVSLADGKDQSLILKDRTAAYYSFSRGVSSQPYPSSLMGSIALFRQMYLDAEWYKNNPTQETNISLEYWNKNQDLPQIFDAGDKLNILRADKIGDEFGKQYIIRGNGDEYQRLDAVKATNAKLIIPVNYPDALDVENPYEATMVELDKLKHWELAPANAANLAKSGIEFAFTASGLKKTDDFLPNVRKAVEYGLDKKIALKALTLTPATLLNAQNLVGSWEKGKIANFIVTDKDLFEKDAKILQNWVQGKPYEINKDNPADIRADYKLVVGSQEFTLKITGSIDKPDYKIFGKDTLKANGKVEGTQIQLSFPKEKDGDLIRLSGWFKDFKMQGEGQAADGSWIKWSAEKTADFAEKKEDKKDEKTNPAENLGKLMYPFRAYGNLEIPKAETVLLKNATVWTNETEGIVNETDVLVKDGKIAQIGKNLSVTGAKVIDATGKHLTSGIIDEHSHIAISRGVNEGVYVNSSEVRIGDVVNSEDINIYRQLAGGVVAAQLLHGSANPIGGQSALVKLRWGQLPENMKIQGADGFIKFALGENVVHANYGSFGTTRFPQTRMGVEQVYVDAFTRAKEYEKNMKLNPKGTRKDLQMETMLEILNKKRFVSCHSYVQSEINMLMKVAEKFNFRINTFTHILEGYKVADKMKEHGVSASTFSDWWAYKYEVIHAIPYNAAIMTKVGVNTAINSDDAEMARRLNQEAAKTVKYGNMTEEQAWKMVTLNPAKMLHLDKNMGSVKVGKDADLVVWSDNPLSVYAKAEKTFVDGVLYFDREKDAQMRTEIQTERNRLIQKMINAKNGGAVTKKVQPKKDKMWHCEDWEDVWGEEQAESEKE